MSTRRPSGNGKSSAEPAAESTARRQRSIQAEQDQRDRADKADKAKKGDDKKQPVQAGARREPEKPPAQHIAKPGHESELELAPQFLAPDYRGSGKLEGFAAIVTGADSGIGRAVAVLFAREGADVTVAYLDEHDDAEETRRCIEAEGRRCVLVAGDIKKAKFAQKVVAKTIEAFGRLDVVVNNAGWSHKNGPLLDVDEAAFDKVYAINVKSIFHMTHAVVPILRKQKRGVIVNIGSTAGIRPRPGLTWYNSTKGAVNLMSKSLAVELAPDNIRVNVICPVMGVTGLLEQFMGMPDTPENRKKFLATIPLGRLSTPLDIARAAVFLASDDAEFITGVEFPVDGGRTV
jgi:3-oxoacyl-[acyl-carrier protein] reductase